jgi:Rieske 2Fe-2S family protein
MNDRVVELFRPGAPAFDQTRLPVEEARHAPGFIYTSPEIFALEKERIFMRDWLCMGREEEIPAKGDYIATRVLDEPVLIVRGDGGEINVFANVCAHRGAEVATGCGNKRAFTCPFHGWTYNLQGRLIGAAHMAEGFEPASCELPRLRVARWKGWIFINFDKDAPDFSTRVEQFEKDFGYLRQEDCRLAVKTVSETNCNWKLVVENLIDFYHLNVVHRGTNGRSFTKEAFRFTPRPGGSYIAEYNSGPSTPSQKPVFGKAPWMEDKPNDFSTGGLLAPNFTLFGRVDTVHPYVTWPLSLNRTRIIVYTLLPKVYFDRPNFAAEVEAYRTFQKQVLTEDSDMLASVQNGVGSRNFMPGRMATLERGSQHVLNAYLDRMFPAA